MRLLFALLFVIALITVVTDTRAGVVVEPAYDENQLDWVDPNESTKDFKKFYTSQHGLTCENQIYQIYHFCLLYTSPSPRDQRGSRMPSSA